MANLQLRWLLTALTVVVLWPTTAILSLYGEESVIRFVGPTDLLQQRLANEAVTTIPHQTATQPALLEFSLPQFGTTLESIFRHASEKTIRVANRQPTAPTELPPPDDGVETVETPNASVSGNEKRPRCNLGPALATLSTDIALPAGTLPSDFAAHCAATHAPIIDPRIQQGWAITNHHWSATGQRHRPLYFEEINAERYGYTASYCLQPLISAGRFFLTIPALPYKMATQCPKSCDYTLGHYRPGSCAPRRWSRLPLNATGTMAQVGIVAGLILLIP